MAFASLRTVLLASAVAVAGCRVAAAQEPVPPSQLCEVAGAAAERQHGVPAGLLAAIGRVESGRRDPATGVVAAWPWTINAEGRGKLFDSQAEALAGTRAIQAGGVASIDVGCFQVNLVHHRAAFATLEDAFDPGRNADYAARFLVSLRTRGGSWEQAVADYHSASPERGIPYRDRVLAGWLLRGPATPPALPQQVPAVRAVAWVPPVGGGMRIWTPSAPGQGASMITLQAPRLPRG